MCLASEPSSYPPSLVSGGVASHCVLHPGPIRSLNLPPPPRSFYWPPDVCGWGGPGWPHWDRTPNRNHIRNCTPNNKLSDLVLLTAKFPNPKFPNSLI